MLEEEKFKNSESKKNPMHPYHRRGTVGLTLGFLGILFVVGYFLIDTGTIKFAAGISQRTLILFFAGYTGILSLILIGHALKPDYRY
jgi:hypothetical protein